MNNATGSADNGRLITEAKARAVQLRREAVDAFWHRLGGAMRRALSATRLAGFRREV